MRAIEQVYKILDTYVKHQSPIAGYVPSEPNEGGYCAVGSENVGLWTSLEYSFSHFCILFRQDPDWRPEKGYVLIIEPVIYKKHDISDDKLTEDVMRVVHELQSILPLRDSESVVVEPVKKRDY